MSDPKLGIKRFTENDRMYRITVKGGLHKIGDQDPYFSITADIELLRDGTWKEDSGGCIHGEIEKHFPGKFTDMIAMHISNQRGVPMHAVEDGWYWLAGAVPGNYGEKFHGRNLKMQHYKDDGTFDDYRESTPEECLKVLAKHLRISVEQAAQLTKDIVIEKLSDAELKKLSVDEVHLVEKALRREAKGRFKEFVETQLTRWMDEARECTNKHCLEVY